MFNKATQAPPSLVKAQALDMSRSEDLLCRNLVCERVGEPCICRLAVVLERHAATLAWLSLAGNGLTQLPAALTALPALRYLDVSANGLLALPDGFTDLRSLQVAPRLCGRCYYQSRVSLRGQLPITLTSRWLLARSGCHALESGILQAWQRIFRLMVGCGTSQSHEALRLLSDRVQCE